MVKERHTHTYTCSNTTASTNQQGTAHYLCHQHTNTYSLFWNPCPLIPTQTYFHTHICTHRCTHNPFIACAASLCFFPAMFVCIVWVCVCLQVRSAKCAAFTVKHCTREIGINTFCSVICHIFTRLKPSEHQSILLWCHLSNCPMLQRWTHTSTHKYTQLHTEGKQIQHAHALFTTV